MLDTRHIRDAKLGSNSTDYPTLETIPVLIREIVESQHMGLPLRESRSHPDPPLPRDFR